jgi:abnormal spindle-like microcephaly-associated protein
MENILQNRKLSNELRVPPVSRLQKIHNVDVALSALKDTGYVLSGNITAKDISDGHREKTLSLLWQIIYKFQVTSVYP